MMNSKAAFFLKHLPALLVLTLFLAAPVSARADALSDLYGTTYDRSEVIEAGEADDPNAELDDLSDNDVQTYLLDDSSDIASKPSPSRHGTFHPRCSTFANGRAGKTITRALAGAMDTMQWATSSLTTAMTLVHS